MHFYYLFMEFKERYYFLIIFPEDKYSNNNWYLGLPFIKRYQFIFNYDLKTIGFYNENIKEKNNTNDETNGDGKSNKNKNVRLIIEISVGILLIGLIVVAFIIGKRINNRRKNRANELNDDNYEYFSQENNNNPGNYLNS